jgi:hypothetical protein
VRRDAGAGDHDGGGARRSARAQTTWPRVDVASLKLEDILTTRREAVHGLPFGHGRHAHYLGLSAS